MQGAELPERDDLEPAVEETLAMLETNWGAEGDAVKGELIYRVPSSEFRSLPHTHVCTLRPSPRLRRRSANFFSTL